jgi:uncharacterized membrane protein YccF (DUF307 family)
MPTGAQAVKALLNILWLVLAGLWLGIGYFIAGVLTCITIIGIPFGVQSFKLANYALWPFGRVVVQRSDRNFVVSAVGNLIWLILGGIWLALGHLVAGLLLCITIIGIPLGVASFKMIPLALVPFGKQIVKAEQLRPGDKVAAAVPS